MMKKLLILCVILGLIAASCCTRKTRAERITIEEINQDPVKFYDKEVVLRGLITQSYDVPLLKHDIYKINDGTVEIWVNTEKSGLPDRIEVKVSGILKKFIQLPFKLPIELEIDHYIRLQNLEFLRI
jgi:hypothetical protein